MKTFGHGYKLKNKKWYSRSYLAHCSDTFGYMFPRLARKSNKVLPQTTSVRNDMKLLGTEMGLKAGITTGNLPAGYTYLGQFIDHDITLDAFSDIDSDLAPSDVEKLNNFRSPGLDLDSVYGRGPSVDPYLYVQNSGDHQEDGIKLLLGSNTDTGPGGPHDASGTHIVRTDFDVPRTSNHTAIIGDPRNNENLFVSQIHHAFLKFHNAVVDRLKGTVPDNMLFIEARIKVVQHYQWVVLHDFLKRIAKPNEVDASISNQRFFRRRPFKMPVEFSVGAFRFGHSLVRQLYDFNDNFIGEGFMKAFEFIRHPRLPVFSNWVVDFNRFFDTGNGLPINLARSFDTALAPILSNLPNEPTPFMSHLAQRNLVRAIALRVPTGQAIAKRFSVGTLTKAELLSGNSASENSILQKNNDKFVKKTPLWYYILKEAEVRENGERLGTLGSRILAETFTRILRDNPNSILRTPFTPDLNRISGKPAGGFDMADLLNFAGVLN